LLDSPIYSRLPADVSSVKSFDAGKEKENDGPFLHAMTHRAEIAHHTQGLVNNGGEEGAYKEDGGVDRGCGEGWGGEGEAAPSENREGRKGMEST
jgi:hypothetical protein